MALAKLTFRPGIDKERTRYANEDGWIAGDKVRFRGGYPEKIGGWRRWVDGAFAGVARLLKSWVTLGGIHLVGVGTNEKFLVIRNNQWGDITPLRTYASSVQVTDALATGIGLSQVQLSINNHGLVDGDAIRIQGATAVGGIEADILNRRYEVAVVDSATVSFETFVVADSTASGGGTFDVVLYHSQQYATDPFSGTDGSSEVEVTLPGHLLRIGDYVEVSGAIGLGGAVTDAILNQEHRVASVIDVNTFSIDVGVAATALDVGGGGNVTFAAQIPVGTELPAASHGWGAGGWGLGPWGEGVPGLQAMRMWSADNFGQDLIYGYRGGPLYIWSPESSAPLRGRELALYSDDGAPTVQNGVMVAGDSRIIMAWGVNDYFSNVADPMLIRWSGQEDPYTWYPAVTNQAGSLRLDMGSEIMTVQKTRQELIVITDRAVYSLQYTDPPVVFAQTLLGGEITIASPNAATVVTDTVYWMGRDQFYMYDGQVRVLPSTLHRYVYSRINEEQLSQTHAGHNPGEGEVWWFYCAGASTTITDYVVYNYQDDIWYYGTMDRTAWVVPVQGRRPLAATPRNAVVEQEFEADDREQAQVQPIPAYILSADMDMDDGEQFTFIRRVLPDVEFTGPTPGQQVTLSLYSMRNAGAPPRDEGDATVLRTASSPIGAEFTGQVYIRIRGRHIRFEISSDSVGTQWQLGAVRIDARTDGRK